MKGEEIMPSHVKDLAGLGEIIGHLTRIILKLIDCWTKREEQRHRNRQMELHNVRDWLQIARDFGLSVEELKSREALLNELTERLSARSSDSVESSPCPDTKVIQGRAEHEIASERIVGYRGGLGATTGGLHR
jgi:hypothetical protein